MPTMQLVVSLGLLCLAALSGAFAWSAYRSGRMKQRYGGDLREAERPRLFKVLLALRASTVLLLIALAGAVACGWLPLGRA